MNLLQTADGYHTTFLAPLMIFGWILLSIFFFNRMPTRKAILFTVVGGVLFLPMARYDIPVIGSFDKNVSITLGLVLGSLLTGKNKTHPLKITRFDIPMIVWCFFSPVTTSIVNGLGLYDGIYFAISNVLRYGVVFWVGRRFFNDYDAIKEIVLAIFFGGIIYSFFCAFEIRIGPLLSTWIYGFFPHSWIQHVRYGGFRPIVFMQHGLMVALWMAVSTTVAFWLWREKRITHVGPVPMLLVVLAMLIVTIFCRSANGWFFLFLGIAIYPIAKRCNTAKFLQIIILIVFLYMISRLYGLISRELVQRFAGMIFDDDRITSLLVRLRQEDLFGEHALQRALFGWGGYNRSRPIDPLTGMMISAVDSLWVIIVSSSGLIGLASVYISLGMGPWFGSRINGFGRRSSEKNREENFYIILASLVVIFFMVDSLLNSMFNPIFFLTAGALASVHREKELLQVSIVGENNLNRVNN